LSVGFRCWCSVVRPAATDGEKERPDGDCETEQSDCSLQHLNRPPLLEFFGFFEVIPDAPLPLRPEQPFSPSPPFLCFFVNSSFVLCIPPLVLTEVCLNYEHGGAAV
jgi:hypothetical protein